MKRTQIVLLAVLTIGVAAFPVRAEKLKIELPADTVAFKRGTGVELAMANCVICHSPEYVSMQPPMPKKFWLAEVQKMQQKYGAPVQATQVDAIVEYLTTTYGVSDKK